MFVSTLLRHHRRFEYDPLTKKARLTLGSSVYQLGVVSTRRYDPNGREWPNPDEPLWHQRVASCVKDGVIDSFDRPVVEGMIYEDTYNGLVVTKGDKKYSITYVVEQGDSDDDAPPFPDEDNDGADDDDDEWGGDDDDDDEWGSDDGFDWGSHASFLSDETQ